MQLQVPLGAALPDQKMPEVAIFRAEKGLLDAVGNWGSRPFRRTGAELPEPILECPNFANEFFQSVKGKVLKFCMTGSQAVNEGLQAGCLLTKNRRHIRIGASIWYAPDERYLSSVLEVHVLQVWSEWGPLPMAAPERAEAAPHRTCASCPRNALRQGADRLRHRLHGGNPIQHDAGAEVIFFV